MNKADQLNEWLLGYWDKIATHGGELNFYPSIKSYELSAIYICCSGQWIQISSMEMNEDLFFICLNKIDTPPIPEINKRNRPPRAQVLTFPKDCRLDKLFYGQIKSIEAFDIKYQDDMILIEGYLVLRSKSDDYFRIIPSDEFLGSIEIMQLSGKKHLYEIPN